MKKTIITIMVCSTFIMCKKGESVNLSSERITQPIDSTVTDVNSKVNDIQQESKAVFDSANIKIKELDKTKSKAMHTIEETAKSIDSLSEKISSLNLGLLSKKDSSENKNDKITSNIPAPKVIKETRIVYKTESKPKNIPVKDIITKNGIIEINAENTEASKEKVKQFISKYDGILKSENTSLNNNENKIAYLKAKVPIQTFDYLMDDLNYNIGIVENKTVETNGSTYKNDILCDVEITIYGKTENPIKPEEPQSFGGKSLAAVSSGWNVITSVFLFLLPFWPLFLILGTAYHFYKKRLRNSSDKKNN
ncbi:MULTISPECIES: DUF4349 domain-containing protein [Chryseobacterium]|uniref:DUF4349 domain-containing protein n=1 Tax=Chryseobacterium taihuense TaxID=1141221 RepID=A0A4V6YTJ8_9FLAO|nr:MULTISPECIES: DUF4349 domain-containing protein [Chryseobacterium]QQV01438.1 hypothetical protein I6I61_10020 [Chryseobacterium sp. FDAARGOS 1104]VFB05374.1 Uncharacterised protein [Chryseobacterium taihuense]